MVIALALGWGGRLNDGWGRAGRCGQETRSLPTDTASTLLVSHQKRQLGGGIVHRRLVLGGA